MEQKSMTALVSAFVRAYHSQSNEVKIFDDSVARRLLTDEEYVQISKSMSGGIQFFNPAFEGTSKKALRWVVDHQLSPSPLGRSAFAEKSLQRAVSVGAKQYIMLGAGYDTFAYRQPSWADALEIFEVDHPATAADKRNRLEHAKFILLNNVHFIEADFIHETWQEALIEHEKFDRSKISFCSILGVTYYLSEQTFEGVVSSISAFLPKGSSILFDYPDENSYTEQAGERAKKQSMLAGTANESMLASYSYQKMEQLLSAHEFLIYEHLTPREITAQYFAAYNKANTTHSMTAFDNVNYCLAVKA